MNTYAERKKSVPQPGEAAPAPENIQPQLDAMQNIDVHSGHSLQLEDGLKSRIEQHLGYDLSGVELRESRDAADMGAQAFAKGNVVHFAPGQFDQHSEQGQHLITHELSHVVQQARGGVHADVDGFNVNASAALEGAAEHSGDSFVSGGHSSLAAPLMSLPAMNADAAPVQGSFFGKIKNFFRKQKESFGFGRALRNKDNVVDEITAEHESTEADMVKAMREQGFSDDEIEAQKMFQRVNMSDSRAARYQEAQTQSRLAAGNFDDPRMMTNMASQLGRGTLTGASRDSMAARENSMIYNILAGNDEVRQAEGMADALTQKFDRQRRASGELDRINATKDEGNAAFTAAIQRYNARHGTQFNRDSGDVRAVRYLARHLRGLDDQTADTMFDDMVSGDKARMAPHIKAGIDKFMSAADLNAIDASRSDDELINGAANQIIASHDNMTLSDYISSNDFDAAALGVTPEYMQRYYDTKMAHGRRMGDAFVRLKRMKNN